jgi:hypothetical protein
VYRVPPEEAGHKCFFARTFSFSPLDKPHDVFALDPVNDRHTGQKNLHIVAQGAAYKFSLIHLANAEETIQIIPMGLQELFGIGDPALGKFRFREGFPADFFHGQELGVFSPTQNVQVRSTGQGFSVNAQGEGPGVGEQAEIMRAFSGALREIEAGKAKPSEFREVFAARRKMNAFVQKTTFTLQLPFLQLQQGEALAWKITNINNLTGEVRGGITLIMTGLG